MAVANHLNPSQRLDVNVERLEDRRVGIRGNLEATVVLVELRLVTEVLGLDITAQRIHALEGVLADLARGADQHTEHDGPNETTGSQERQRIGRQREIEGLVHWSFSLLRVSVFVVIVT